MGAEAVPEGSNSGGQTPMLTVVENEHSAATTPPPPPMMAKLEPIDMLEMENLDLKIRNQQLVLQSLEHQKLQVVSAVGELAKALEAKRLELTKKYGTPIRRDTVAADGTLLAKTKKP
jgi:hypothetical protein